MIDKIGHYSLENPTSIYDEEAMTALELAGRTAKKVNEVIDQSNKLDKDTREFIERKETELNEFVKNTTEKVIPESITYEVDRKIYSGEFDESISRYAGGLEARLDNMLGSLEEGGTTADAEIIDNRLGTDNMKYTCMGEASRNQFELKQDIPFKLTEIPLTIITGELYNIHSNQTEAVELGRHAIYDFQGEKIICVDGFQWAWDGFPAFALYDAEGNRIFKYFQKAYDQLHKMVIHLPSNATRIIINGRNNSYKMALYKCDPLNDGLRGYENISADQLMNYRKTGATVLVETKMTAENTEYMLGVMYSEDGNIVDYYLSEPYSTIVYPIPRGWKSVLLNEYNIGVTGGAFLDKNHTWISSFQTNYPNHLDKKVIPENARYLAISVKDASPYHSIYAEIESYTLGGLVTEKSTNQWTGKKVVWIGTSIPYGQGSTKSYAKEVSDALGFELVPAVLSGMAIHTDNGNIRMGGSLCLSKAEYSNHGVTIADKPANWTPGGANNNFYGCYDNVFSQANRDADMFIFDCLPNNGNFDTTDWDNFDHVNWVYKDGSSFANHRNTFLGALIFLLDKMYALNPSARCAFVVGSDLNYDKGLEAIKMVSEKWRIPILNVWNKIACVPPTRGKLFVNYGEDHHLVTYTHELIGRMLTGEFLGIA